MVSFVPQIEMPTRLTVSGAMLTAKKMSALQSYKKARADYGQCKMRRPCQQPRNYPVGYSSRYFATAKKKGIFVAPLGMPRASTYMQWVERALDEWIDPALRGTFF